MENNLVRLLHGRVDLTSRTAQVLVDHYQIQAVAGDQ